jgi:hypothetical protein
VKSKQISVPASIKDLTLPYNNANPSASAFVVTQNSPALTPTWSTQKTRQGYEIPVPTHKAVLGDLKRVAKSPPKPKPAH